MIHLWLLAFVAFVLQYQFVLRFLCLVIVLYVLIRFGALVSVYVFMFNAHHGLLLLCRRFSFIPLSRVPYLIFAALNCFFFTILLCGELLYSSLQKFQRFSLTKRGSRFTILGLNKKEKNKKNWKKRHSQPFIRSAMTNK